MATAESVKAKLQGLIATANATTGNADADLTTAVNALVAGFGQGGGGGLPGVDVIKGEYIPGQTIGAFAVKLVHGLGAIKPLIFHMKARGSHFEDGYANAVYEVAIMVSFVEERNVTYGADATAAIIEPKTQVGAMLFSGGGIGSGSGSVELHNSEVNNSGSYAAKMWPDGFTVGLYRNLLAGYTYDYTLIYGDLFGGAE